MSYHKGPKDIGMVSQLQLKDFYYPLPMEQIAQHPLPDRDASRLLVCPDPMYAGLFPEYTFRQLDELIQPGTLLIVNDSQVFACRLRAKKSTGALIEVFLLHMPYVGPEGRLQAECFVRPARKIAHTDVLECVGWRRDMPKLWLKLQQDMDTGGYKVDFLYPKENGPVVHGFSPVDLMTWLAGYAQTPLPPYIKRPKWPDVETHIKDEQRYQTVYAGLPGSVAAPTAGLHMTHALWERLRAKGVRVCPVTLHVGAGTFLPVKVAHMDLHLMHEESFKMPKETFQAIRQATEEGRPVVFVGTTSLRATESFFRQAQGDWDKAQALVNLPLKTQLFIYPQHREHRIEPFVGCGLITNFHQPESTLFMMVCALLGYEQAHRMYAQALEHGFRFLSYGDSSMFWWKATPVN
jgi:S-adenosylmethionine:tRNA ribosyltransferase-isomerase